MKRILFPLLLLLIAAVAGTAQTASILTLHPPPKSAFQRNGQFTLNKSTSLFISDHPDDGTLRAMAWLQARLKERIGDTLKVITVKEFKGGPIMAVGTLAGADSAMIYHIRRMMPPGETMPEHTGGYILDISQGAVALIGTDAEGAFNGVATLLQLIDPKEGTAVLRAAHIMDYPDYPIRWVFSQHNLRGTNAITELRSIQDTMAAYKLNGLQQNDFKYAILGEQPDYYFDSVARLKTLSSERNIEIIPGVAGIGYSSGLLWHDPNLAEGFPAYAAYRIEGDTGRLITDPQMTLPNGGFEAVDGNGKFTGWSFYDGQTNDANVFVDKTIFRSGTASARCTNFRSGDQAGIGNCRFSRKVDCQPFGHYLLSAWVRTKDLNGGEVRLLAIGMNDTGGTRVLTYTAFSLPATTSDWTKVEVPFNTLDFPQVQLYAGIWGGEEGTIWWDDVTVTAAGLTNVLRRDGTPFTLKQAKVGGTSFAEGIDFAPVVDTVMAKNHGSYGPYHQPPTLRRLPGGSLKNGDTVLASFYHPLTTVADIEGNGSVMVCLSEDTLYTLIADQISRVDDLYSPSHFFLGHDEIRAMNHDLACTSRDMTPAELLADNLTRSLAIVDTVHPDAYTYVWSDMFDSLHNAHDDYYLVNGDLTGVWDLIPRSVTIVNWNSAESFTSPEWFAGQGFNQIVTPFYDNPAPSAIHAWRMGVEGLPNIHGMMYTTWQSDFSLLKPYAYYAWGAGPYIVHTPLDSAGMIKVVPGDSVRIEAIIQSDPYSTLDYIDEATARITVGTNLPTLEEVKLTRDTGNLYIGYSHLAAQRKTFTYHIEAADYYGLTRRTPEYLVSLGTSAAPETPEIASRYKLAVFPNPASGVTTVRITTPGPGAWELSVVDLLGRTLLTRIGENDLAAERSVSIDVGALPPGLYHCVLRTADVTMAQRFTVSR